MITDPSERSRLLTQLQRQLRERLTPPLQALFNDLDTQLFDLAERSRGGAQQHAFFDGLRECRRKRSDIERDFLEAVARVLRPSSPTSIDAPHSEALALLANDELEEKLAISALADRTATRLAPSLEALDRRIAMLLNVMRVPSEPLRLAPQALGAAFRIACQRLDVGIEVRLVAYTLFGHHILDTLESVYADLNRELIAAGILPAIAAPGIRSRDPSTRSLPRPPTVPIGGQPNDSGSRAESPIGRPAIDLRHEQGDDNEAMIGVVQELRRLLTAQSAAHNAPPTAFPATAANQPAATLAPERVLEALNRLQDFSDDPRRLKAQLLEVSRRLGSDANAALRAHDESTVDLIGMVFDFVRHDPNLPGPMQPLIAKLQVPFLKAALSEPELMNAADHPARLLMDELGELALGWTPSTDPEGQLVGRIKQTVDALLQQHEAGRAPFERAISELQNYLEISRHRADVAEQRAVESSLGRERLRIARSRVAAMLDRRLSRYAPLPWIRQLLRGPWANYLVLLWLRQGETGESYREGMAFVDELLWCDEHGGSSSDDERLLSDGEDLEEDLRHGLSTVAYHDREIERLAGEMRQFLASLRRRTLAPSFLYEIDPKLGTADFSQSWTEHDLEDQPLAENVDASLLARLRSLAPGTWFEFGGRSNERAKLSWTSPFSGRFLLVNRNGLRVDEIAPERLAEEIQRGLTRVLENTRLFQRALQTLLGQMRTQTSHSRRDSA